MSATKKKRRKSGPGPRKSRETVYFQACMHQPLRREMNRFQKRYNVNWSHWFRVAVRARMRNRCGDEEHEG